MQFSFVISTSNIDWIETLRYIATSIILPVLVAAVTYLLVDRLGEYKKRKTYSRLGIAIIESLQEEIQVGIDLMKKTLASAEDNNTNFPSCEFLPDKSWNGMVTIPDDVLLRIIETSKDKKFIDFHPRDIRIHCKNYFHHMVTNFTLRCKLSIDIANMGKDWRTPLVNLLSDQDDKSKYIESAVKVNQMLTNAKILLEENTKRCCPK